MAQEWINGILDEFKDASDPVQFINLNSDSPFNSSFLGKSDIENEDLADWAFSASVGAVFPPYFDDESFKTVRLVERALLPDSVRARHILIQPQGNNPAMLAQAEGKADSLLSVLKRGGNFANLAQQYSDDPGSASKGGDLGWFTEGTMVQPFNDAAFSASRGEIVMVESQFGFHIIEVLQRGAPSPKVQLATLERRLVPSNRTYQINYSKASEFAGENTTYEQFSQAVHDELLTNRMASNLKEEDRRIAGLENPREMIRWAYQAKEGDVSPVFEMGENFVVASLVKARKDGPAPLSDVKALIKQQLIKDKKGNLIALEFEAAMASTSNINDLASGLNLTPQQASDITFASISIPRAGFEPVLIATAVQSAEAELVGPVKGHSGVYALSVISINIGEGNFEAERSRLKRSYRTRTFQEFYESLKRDADIKDYRARFF